MHANRISRYTKELPRAAVERAFGCFDAIIKAGLLSRFREELLAMRADRWGIKYETPDEQSLRRLKASELASVLGEDRDRVVEIVDDLHVPPEKVGVLRLLAKYELRAKEELERVNNNQ